MRFGLAYDFRNPTTGRNPMTGERSWPEVFADLLDQIAYADTLGFDSVWITEHHFAQDGYAPSPMTLCTIKRPRSGTSASFRAFAA